MLQIQDKSTYIKGISCSSLQSAGTFFLVEGVRITFCIIKTVCRKKTEQFTYVRLVMWFFKLFFIYFFSFLVYPFISPFPLYCMLKILSCEFVKSK